MKKLFLLAFFCLGLGCKTFVEREYPRDHFLGTFSMLPTVDSDISFFSKTNLRKFVSFEPQIKIYSAPIIRMTVKSSKRPYAKLGEFIFLIDIGSNINLINSSKIQNIHGNKNKIPTHGINGKNLLDLEEIYLSLDLSETYTSEYVRFFKTTLPPGLPVDGILGNEFFSRFNVYMEYPDNLYFLKKEKIAYGIRNQFAKVKPHPSIYSHWVVELEIKEEIKNFIFDTGASYSTLNKVEQYQLKLNRTGELRIVDFAGMDKKSPIYTLPQYCLVSTPKICKKDLHLFGDFDIRNFFQNQDVPVSGLLGMNFIKHYNVMFDYSTHTIYLQKK